MKPKFPAQVMATSGRPAFVCDLYDDDDDLVFINIVDMDEHVRLPVGVYEYDDAIEVANAIASVL